MHTISNKVSLMMLGATVLLSISGGAFAATVSRIQIQHAAGSCQGNLPVSATQLRARPQAIANEGTSSAFISCSLGADDYTGAPNGFNGVVVTNRSAATVNVSCTLVTGGVDFPTAFFPKTISLPASAINVVSFDPATDNGGVPFNNALNYSCSVAPGVEINAVFTNIDEEIGT